MRAVCLEIFRLRRIEQEAKERYGELQETVKEYFASSDEDFLQFSDGEKFFKVKNVVPRKIVWDVKKLQKRFKKNDIPDDVKNQVITKEIKINDWERFSSILKKHGVRFDEVSDCISVGYKVDQKRIDELFELGEILPDDIAGCYTVEVSSGYLKLSESEMSDEEE